MPKTKTGLPTDEELRTTANWITAINFEAEGDEASEIEKALREVLARTLRWAMCLWESWPPCSPHDVIEEELRKAAGKAERG